MFFLITDDESHLFASRSFEITFSLALTSHLRSIELDSNGDKNLATQTITLAKKLYILALQIEESEAFGAHLSAAVLKNLSQVRRSIGADEESMHCDQHSLSNLILLVDTRNLPALSTILVGFMNNVSFQLLKYDMVAAAA